MLTELALTVKSKYSRTDPQIESGFAPETKNRILVLSEDALLSLKFTNRAE